jgi:hypothetical protein
LKRGSNTKKKKNNNNKLNEVMYLEEECTKRDGATCRDGWNNTPKKE